MEKTSNKNRKLAGFGIAAAVAVALAAWLAFGVFGIHTALIDETVSEANPFTVQTTIDQAAEPAGEEALDELASAAPPVADEPNADEPAANDPETTDAAAVEDEPTEAVTAPIQPAEPAEPVITQLATGTLVDHDHSGEGTAVVLTDGTQRFLRFEDDFDIDNGPDLNVYLVRGVDAAGPAGQFDDDFVDLGDLKGNKGAQNYEIPANVELDEYDTVVIWCVRFGVAFNAADLT